MNPSRQMVVEYRAKKAAEKEFQKNYEKLALKIEKEVSRKYHLLWLLALRDKQGYGAKRLADTLTKVIEIAEDIADYRIDFEDIAQAIKDETGLEV